MALVTGAEAHRIGASEERRLKGLRRRTALVAPIDKSNRLLLRLRCQRGHAERKKRETS
jgi:hypothetical protein